VKKKKKGGARYIGTYPGELKYKQRLGYQDWEDPGRATADLRAMAFPDAVGCCGTGTRY